MIPVAEPCIGEEELKNVIEAVKSGWISSKGKFIEEFESNFSSFCNVKYGVATSNGTAALHLALKTLGIKEGDEVIVPDLTFIATANTVTYCNAKPIFIDSQPDYWCMDPYKIEEKITSKTKAIIPVHLYGHPCDMDKIMEIARENEMYVIEDVAEAHGSKYKDKIMGSFGDINCFSFYGNKVITTGEGGMCLTNDEELADIMKKLRDHGMSREKKYWHDVIGFNYRMTNLQAAVGVAQLTKINQFIEKKRQISNWYYTGLNDLETKGLITLHPEMEWAKNIYWMYCILLNDSFPMKRDDFLEEMRKYEIDTRPFFYSTHLMPFYNDKHRDLKISEDISSRGLNLPSSPNLQKKDIDFITDSINKIAGM